MSNNDPQIAQLIAEITAAFDGVPREDGTTLREGEEIDCHGSPAERLAARRLDTDTRWQDVPDAWIEEFPSAFSFMDVKGFRYYLPAVMIWTLRQHMGLISPSDCAVDDDIVFDLLDPERPRIRHAIFSILTDAQRRAVAKWLQFVINNCWADPREQAARLDISPWRTYLPP